jgi:hypothetical protein
MDVCVVLQKDKRQSGGQEDKETPTDEVQTEYKLLRTVQSAVQWVSAVLPGAWR